MYTLSMGIFSGTICFNKNVIKIVNKLVFIALDVTSYTNKEQTTKGVYFVIDNRKTAKKVFF